MQPTHYKGHTLDVVITRDTSELVDEVQLREIGLTNDNGISIHDHYAISCNVKLSVKQSNKEKIFYRNFRSINIDNLRSNINTTVFNPIRSGGGGGFKSPPSEFLLSRI